MEYIDGPLLKGPLPLEQVFKYAAQICDALDAAHGKGIVHRDLKPANILVTKSGVKLLDFGLAKWSRSRAGAAPAATETIALTKDNTILGTLQYMSPEQLEAKDADARSDIFAFGAVLYEMVTGKRAFAGESQASVTAAIMERQPPPLTSVVPVASPSLERVVAKCLAKDPDRRWQSARDLKDELEWIAGAGAPVATAAAPARKPWREYAAWILTVTLLGALAALYLRPRPAAEISRFVIYPPEKTVLAGSQTATVTAPTIALSPDGRAIVFAASEAGARPMLWLRRMDEVAARPVPGTESAQDPIWSPDSRWVGFFSEGKLKKIPAGGGPIQVVSDHLGESRGGSWGPGDTILVSAGNSPIYSIPSAGGKATPVTGFDASRQEKSHRWPHLLPDGRHFLFTVRGSPEASGVYAGSLDGKTRKFLLHLDTSTQYVSPGYLLFLEGDTLLAQAFDAQRLELTGQAFSVAAQVGHSTYGYGPVSVSQTGTLAYAGPILHRGRLTWFDRAGNSLEPVNDEGDYADFRLSPDDNRLATSLVNPRRGFPDIWLTDLTRRSTSLFESTQLVNAGPVWSPDGARLLFRTSRNGLIEIFQKSAAGGGSDEPVLTDAAQRVAHLGAINVLPTDWSPDAANIVYTVTTGESGYDIWVLPLADKKPVRFLGSPADEMHGNFSPDGRFLAYTSNETGRYEVYVQTFPQSERRWQVSTSGGYEPRWRRDGREIYYLSEDRKLMAVSIGAGPSFGVPKPLFQTRVPVGVSALRTNYVPARDGQRFLINTQTSDPPPNPITVVLNWAASLKQ